MTRAEHAYAWQNRQKVHEHTTRIISRMQERFMQEVPDARAQLARLRNAGSAPLGSQPEVFAAIYDELPKELEGRGEGPSQAELAIHAAACLYAIHQQSVPDQRMHRDLPERTRSLGSGIAGIGRIAAGEDQDRPIARRFNAIITADGFPEIRHHLRGIIQLLRQKRIPLDYGLLAADLYQLQYPAQRNHVRLRWSRDALYFRGKTAAEEAANDNSTAPEPHAAER